MPACDGNVNFFPARCVNRTSCAACGQEVAMEALLYALGAALLVVLLFRAGQRNAE